MIGRDTCAKGRVVHLVDSYVNPNLREVADSQLLIGHVRKDEGKKIPGEAEFFSLQLIYSSPNNPKVQ